MRFLLFVFLMGACPAGWVMAQDAVTDTLMLQDLTIYGISIQNYSGGYKIIKFDSSDLSLNHVNSLGEFLSANTPIFFKSYGNGMASTISFRGTGASHTAVFWNGHAVNQPTLGQTDFSIIPLFAVEQIDLHHGSAGALFGSDAIGGSILLHTGIFPQKRNLLVFTEEILSYGQFKTGVKTVWNTGKMGCKTGLYLNKNPNHFTYKNITRQGSPEEKQEHAAVSQAGLVQDISLPLNEHQELLFNGWFNYMDRQLQPTMSDNDPGDELRNRNLWTNLEYRMNYPGWIVQLKTGFLWDDFLFNGNDQTTSAQYILQGDLEKEWGDVQLRTGWKHNYIDARSDNYADRITEQRTDLYGSANWTGKQWFRLSLNLRQTLIGDMPTPIVPSAGVDLYLLRRSNFEISFNTQAARSYRIPTLNDRFWTPGGNEALLPEEGFNMEAGTTGTLRSKNLEQSFHLGIYQMKIDHWILWVPSGVYWSPGNLKEVWSTGLETHYSGEYEAGNLVFSWHLAYSYAKSVNKERISENDPGYNKQLPYTPLHNGSLNFQGSIKKWVAAVNNQYVGKRYLTHDNRDFLPSYFLADMSVGRSIRLKNHLLSFSGNIYNLLNTGYQVMYLRAMPGRNYGVSIKYEIHK